MKRATQFILGIMIVGVVLAFGGVLPWTYSAADIVIFSLLLGVILKQSRQGEIHLPAPIWPVLFIIWAALSLVPMPAGFVHLICPGRPAIVPMPGSPGGGMHWITMSVYPHATQKSLLKFLGYFGVFILAAYSFDSKQNKNGLVGLLLLLGGFEGVYGLFQYLTKSNKIFAFTKTFDLGQATGTFINHNHFAGILELTVPLMLAASFYFLHLREEGRFLGGGLEHSGRSIPREFQSAFYFFVTVLMLLALVFSFSRSGLLAMMLTLVAMGLVGQARLGKKIWAFTILIIVLVVVGYGMWVGMGPVLSRFQDLHGGGEIGSHTRAQIWKDTLPLIRDYPLTGSGLGTFGTAYRRYQTSVLDFYVDHAHNDYLEMVSDTGLVGALILFVPIVTLWVQMVLFFLDDARRYRRAVLLGCIGSTLSLFLHSFTDFNLHIPGNAMAFAAILGIGYAAVHLEGNAHLKSPEPVRRRTVQ